MISAEAKYALRALIMLAGVPDGQALLIQEIAERQNIPRKFLERILLNLKRAGLVQSRRGARGGYALFKPAAEISFAQVLRLIDGPIAPLPCLSLIAYRKCADCTDETNCEIRRVFGRVAEASREVLEKATIAEAFAQSPALELLEQVSPGPRVRTLR